MSAVSIVIPAYEPGPDLLSALRSILAQTYTDWECVVVNDGSAENLEWVAGLDTRIRLVEQRRGGVAAARNRGIEEASSPLIAFCDADDVWLPEKLVQQVHALGDAALCYTDFERVDVDGNRVGPGYRGVEGYADLLQGNGICTSTVLVRADVLGSGFDPRLEVGEDWDLWLKIAAEHPIVRLDRVLVHYREHEGQVSRDYRALWRDARTVLARHDHPNARQGRRRLRFLAGVQAYDRARESHDIRDLAYALVHAPRYTARSLMRRVLQPVNRRHPMC